MKFLKSHPRVLRRIRFVLKIKITDFFISSRRISGVGNCIKFHTSVLKIGLKINIVGENNTIECMNDVILTNVQIIIRGNNNRILLHNNVSINERTIIWIEDDSCFMEIGENTSVESASFFITESRSEILVGKDCMIAYDVEFRTGDSHSLLDGSNGLRLNSAESILIGDHVWIAPHTVILKGVELAENSVVSTCSLVTKSFRNSGILIGGVPAKVLKENITWKRERI